MSGPDVVPLTFGQKAWLIFECVPLAFFVLVFGLYLAVMTPYLGVPPLAFYLFAAVVILVLGYQALCRLRDLMSGVALVDEDVLERAMSGSGSGRNRLSGRFTRLGRLRMRPAAYFRAQTGARHRLVYSPTSKIVWSLEPLRKVWSRDGD